MESLRPLFWGQGMLLQPQHFQQQDNSHHGRLQHYIQLLLPFAWGVSSIRINESALKNFLFEIDQCEILTFDGTLLRSGFDSGANTAKIAPRSFEHELDASGRPLSVFLGVRRLRAGEPNLRDLNGTSRTQGGGGRHRRFVIEEAEVSDLLLGGESRSQVQYLVCEGHILFDVSNERSQDYELVKIAEVRRSPDGKGGFLSKEYIPPSITLRSSSVLESMLKEIRDLLTAKGRELSDYKRRGSSQAHELTARNFDHVLMVIALSRYIPLFHHHLEIDDTHPHEIYALMRQLVGELSSFSEKVSVLGAQEGEGELEPYLHSDLWKCFSKAREITLQLLAELTASPATEVILSHDGRYFSAKLDSGFFAGNNRYYLAIRTDLSSGQLSRLLQATGKITALEEMQKLQNQALSGLKIEAIESAPEELPMRAHYRYFAIDQRSDHWEKIRQQGSIAVLGSALPSDTEIRLIAIHLK